MTRVAILLAEHPWLEDHLIAWGLRYTGRVRSAPAELTLASLAVGEALDPEPFVARINALLSGKEGPVDSPRIGPRPNGPGNA
jgi:hypothetical protein